MKTYGDLGMRQAGVRLIGPMDLIPDYQLAHMSDAAIGLVVMSSYSDDLDTPMQQGIRQGMARCLWAEFLSRFHVGCGQWTRWRRFFDVINTLHGNLDDGAKVVDTLKGWKHDGSARPDQD